MSLLFICSLALILSFNIGANNAGASMATAYGSNSISKFASVSLIFIFVFLGSVYGGEKVIQTVGSEILTVDLASLNINFTLLILVVPVLAIVIANLLKIPVATTHIVVCTIIGIGLAINSLFYEKIFKIIIWWILTPFAIWIINYIIGKFFYYKIINFISSFQDEKKIDKMLRIFLICSGCFLAFFAGANNSANAAAPIVSLGVINAGNAGLISGLFMALGALFFGGRIIETVAKKITDICIIRAISVHITGGALLGIACFYGIPISLAEIVTAGIIGFSCASKGFSNTIKNNSVSKILKFWIFVPIICVIVSFVITNVLIGVIK